MLHKVSLPVKLEICSNFKASNKITPIPEKYKTPIDVSYKREESKNYTVAIAYNKGGYMVIGKDNIKDIGK